MIAYNKTWLSNRLLHQHAEHAQQSGCLTEGEVGAIRAKYPVDFYNPGIVVRAGLFILTVIIAAFTMGLAGTTLAGLSIFSSPGVLLFFGLITYGVLEFMIKSKNYYKAGVDDALLWLSAGMFSGAFLWLLMNWNTNAYDNQPVIISAFVLLLSLFLALRFTNLLMACLGCLALLSLIYFGWQHLGAFGTATLPFAIIVSSGLIYGLIRRLEGYAGAKYYQGCLDAVQVISLSAGYAAGNYFVVDQLNALLHGGAHQPLRLGFFFWGWTAAVPLALLWAGIRSKNTILLRTGLLLILAPVCTLRYYVYVLPLDVALTLAGIVLIIIVYAVARYLKTPKNGFTTANLNRNDVLDRLKAESFIVSDLSGHISEAPQAPANPFGGGSFGGGGSSGDF